MQPLSRPTYSTFPDLVVLNNVPSRKSNETSGLIDVEVVVGGR
jgi:hypothetical protein